MNNNSAFGLGGEAMISCPNALCGRMFDSFALFPVFGVTQGFLPLQAFNYGVAKKNTKGYGIDQYAIPLAAGLAFISICRANEFFPSLR